MGSRGSARRAVFDQDAAIRHLQIGPLGDDTRAIAFLTDDGDCLITVSDHVRLGQEAGVARHLLDQHLPEAYALADVAVRCEAATCAVAACWLKRLDLVVVADSA
jgi:hypothetical protein